MLIFQLLVYPRLSKRIGVTRLHRVACLVSVPVYLAFPLLSRLHDSGRVLVVASLFLLFLSNLISSVVGGRAVYCGVVNKKVLRFAFAGRQQCEGGWFYCAAFQAEQ